jgi:hypothetical protein
MAAAGRRSDFGLAGAVVRLFVRFDWAAALVSALVVSLAGSGAVGGGGAVVRLPFEFAFCAAMLVVLARVGLVAAVASWVFLYLLAEFPLTWSLSHWYSMTGLIGLALSAALVVSAYRIVMRAQPRRARP